jgi:Ca2+-binding EF-hand superfamily protein
MVLIKQDINDIKAVLKKIKKKIEQLGIGYEGWFLHFDRDNSDAIELYEFVNMIKFLNISINDKLGIMLFRLFDRQNQGFISLAEFTDIIYKRMRPNYKKFVKLERER